MAEITKTDVVGWLRKQACKHHLIAEKYSAAADEAECAEGGGDAGTSGEGASNAERPVSVSVSDVKSYLRGTSKRKPEIAANFGVDGDQLDDILTEENGFQ